MGIRFQEVEDRPEPEDPRRASRYAELTTAVLNTVDTGGSVRVQVPLTELHRVRGALQQHASRRRRSLRMVRRDGATYFWMEGRDE